MKKTIIYTSILLVITLSLVSYGYIATNNRADQLISKLNALEDNLNNNHWENIKNNTESLNQAWEEANFTWSILMDHNEIDKLDLSISKIISLIELEEKEKALTELRIAKELARQMPSNEKIRIENIF
ncbi:DUF4363 family protein [Natroniella sulfidigena]|uniref:DUF4363 family protein n=1 Tax=Natroniella sulfidigena TaxID=723921 RepID=UPI00200A8915|nr:DUF4363 family protein [Natroniella sulfidigena]MCK8816547.1 DUF4363 family protein [Natroniella sulfidigena]